MNYRSVVVLGRAVAIDDESERAAALDALVEHIVPGRTADARGPNGKELRATLVLRVPIDEASVKRRAGGPIDDDEDMYLPVWAGVLPLQYAPGAPIADEQLDPGIELPEYLRNYKIGA